MPSNIVKTLVIVLATLIAGIGGLLVYYFHPLLHPSFFRGTSLVIMTNEFEARPCGGFITAFGEMSLFPPTLSLKNAYHYEAEGLGDAPTPLRQITPELRFWDLGLDADLGMCSARIRQAYKKIEDKEVDHVVLVNFQVVEQLFALVGKVTMDGQTYKSEDLFSTLSRTVSDTDRHDETSLQNRKTPISDLGKATIKKALLNPSIPLRAGRIFHRSMRTGDVYIHGISEEFAPNLDKEIALIEWNLGGAKSSRYLQKELKISLREESPDKWNAKVVLMAEHAGGFDEPLSTYWNGVFELQFPHHFRSKPAQVPAQIAPGGTFRKEFTFQNITLPKDPETGHTEFGVFKSRGQDLVVDLNITTYPQQQLTETNLQVRENVGSYYGPLHQMSNCFSWKSQTDTSAPFVTLHEVISPTILSEELRPQFADQSILAEIHFNESVFLGEGFEISITDKNHENTITANPRISTYKLLDDQRTLLIGFTQPQSQPNERYALGLRDVRDSFGNEINPQMRWTLIHR